MALKSVPAYIFVPALLLLTLLLLFLARILARPGRSSSVLHSGGRKHSFAECRPIRRLAPVRDPFIGLDFLWELAFPPRGADQQMRTALEFFRRLGPTYGVYRWTWRTINTCDARNVQHMLATAFEDFELPALRIEAMGGLFGRGIFVMRRHEWARTRALLKPSFTRRNMAPLVGIIERHFGELAGRVRAAAATDGTVDLQPLFFALTMDTATEFLMGRSTSMLRRQGQRGGGGGGGNSDHRDDSEADQFVHDYFLCCVEAVAHMQRGPLGKLRWNWQVQRAKARVSAYVDRLVDEALGLAAAQAESKMKEAEHGHDHDHARADHDASSGRYNFVEELARGTRDRETLRHQIIHVLLAGRDTTASLLSNLFFALVRDDRVWAKLRAEVMARTSGDSPTEAELRSMTYLRWCINESLRLHPVVPTNARDAVVDTILPRGGGPDGESAMFVRKGTPVTYNVFSMHRDPAIYGERVDEFVPERWDGLRPGWGFLPFNGGPRICIGQQFALLEASYVTARLIQTFDRLEPRDDRPWTELYTLAMCSKNGVWVGIGEGRR